jgi:lysine-specific demethylase/histidyl-hydroxylase NO66
MISLDELLHPITPAEFHSDYDDRKPLHIPAGDGARKRGLLDWGRFNALLDQTSIWNAHNLKLVYNGEPIPPNNTASRSRPSRAGPCGRPRPGCSRCWPWAPASSAAMFRT